MKPRWLYSKAPCLFAFLLFACLLVGFFLFPSFPIYFFVCSFVFLVLSFINYLVVCLFACF